MKKIYAYNCCLICNFWNNLANKKVPFIVREKQIKGTCQKSGNDVAHDHFCTKFDKDVYFVKWLEKKYEAHNKW